jgi:hypothetical protein
MPTHLLPRRARALACVLLTLGAVAAGGPSSAAGALPHTLLYPVARADTGDTVRPDPARGAGPREPRHVHPAPHAHAAHAAHTSHEAAPAALTATARAQLAEARRATTPVATPEAARLAGYRPMFGHVPLQGEHWVRVDRVFADTFDVARPSVLMFAPVAGTPTLVGVAYAFLRPVGAPPPRGFDGADDVWHAHERLAPTPGRHLVMMHAWFADAPDGPFARYNPWLPYLAAGLAPPSARTLADSATGGQARRLGLALAIATAPPLVFEYAGREGGERTQAAVAPHRAALGALVPKLAAAERAGDAAARARLARAAIAHGDAIVAAYRDAVPARPLVQRLVDRTVDEFLGRGHGIEEELGALFGARAGPPPADAARP